MARRVSQGTTRGARHSFEALGPMPITSEFWWRGAIEAWGRGDTKLLAALVTGRGPIPEFARSFLAKLVIGSAKKRRGRPASSHWLRDKMIAERIEQEREGQKAKGVRNAALRAREVVAGQLHLSPDTLRRLARVRKKPKSKRAKRNSAR